MATTIIYSGDLDASTSSPWVEIPISGKYTVQCSFLGSAYVDFSVDGVNPLRVLIANAPGVGNALYPSFTVNTPVAWARVTNPTGDTISGISAAIANI